MAEEYKCKPRELDMIITSEHQLLEKLRASGLPDEEDDDISFYDHSDYD